MLNETLEKKLLLLANKLREKYLTLVILQKHYQSFIRDKNTKSVKQSEIITYQPKAFENPNSVNIKPVITDNSKISRKLSKTIRQVTATGLETTTT